MHILIHTFYHLYVLIYIMLCWEHAISDIKIPFCLTFCHTTTGFLFPKEKRFGEEKEKKSTKVYIRILTINTIFYTNTFLFTKN